MSHPKPDYVSRAGAKLARALDVFQFNPAGLMCADLGSNTGGFVDCLLRSGAAKVYAVERGYGVVAMSLRNDPRVVVMERTDALHVHLPEKVGLVTIDTGWTRQQVVLPAAIRLLAPGGAIISLIKPHYEAQPDLLQSGVLPDELLESVVAPVRASLNDLGLTLIGETESPIRGHGGNREMLWLLRVTN
jgi:23S rRNA (cytidine1920-2'-O)/16S rRNA (cytidine1409-2'-O)-methyltransferase